MADLFFNAQDDAAEIERDLIQELVKAAEKSSHPFRFPTFISKDKLFPQARTMVLRQVEGSEKVLLFYTDKRSEKVAQLKEDNRVALHFYHPQMKLQIRLGGQVKIIEEGENWQAHFSELPEQAYLEYSGNNKPGMPIDSAEGEYGSNLKKARENFAMLQFRFSEMEALQLNGRHHYRILFNYQGRNWKAQWLMP